MMQPLLEPITISSLRLRNRFAMAPMGQVNSPSGIPNAENVDHYRQRAAGGVGLVIGEGTYIRDPASGRSSRAPRLFGRSAIQGWRSVVKAVHDEGAAIVAQLMHQGPGRREPLDYHVGEQSRTPSGLGLNGQPHGEELTLAQIDALIEDYAESARIAREVGFDGIELHGAHGYLLDSFLWKVTNKRTDRFGYDNRMGTTFPVEVVRAVRDAAGSDMALLYRFSQWKLGNYDARIAEAPGVLGSILEPLIDAGVDVLDVSTRRLWEPAFPDQDRELTLAGWAKKLSGRPVIAVGSVGIDAPFDADDVTAGRLTVRGLHAVRERFDRGEFDIIAIGRALLADPYWVSKIAGSSTAPVTMFDKELHAPRLDTT